MKILRERFKQAFSTRWKFTYLEFSTCSTCLHRKKSYVVVRIIDLLMARCGRPFTSKRRNLHWTVTKDWSYRPYIMDSSDWRHQGHKDVNNPHNNIGFLLMKTCATCRKFKVCEFSPSAESLFKSFPMFSTSTYELTFEYKDTIMLD